MSFFDDFIVRPNCALDRSTILCLCVPGFQRQVLNYAPKVDSTIEISVDSAYIYL